MTGINAVIFDIGNVLITWNPEKFYDTVMPSSDDRKKMFETVDLHGMNDRVDRGGPWRDTVYETAAQYPEFETYIRLWFDRWIELATPSIDNSVTLLRALRIKGIPVFALSNFGIESFAYAQGQYPFLKEFDQLYVTGHMGVIKPEARAYEMVEESCGLAPSSLLFTDDRQVNIEAARLRGWRTHLFDGPAGWAARLVSEGLLTPREADLEP
ncbi:MAG: HAD family phosphatase [Rhodobacteraceae bacterium]|nr:HAD family phosphatase [Paracoccaceae bacterium]